MKIKYFRVLCLLLIAQAFMTDAIMADESILKDKNTLKEIPPQCDAQWLEEHVSHRLPCYLLEDEPISDWKIMRSTYQEVKHDGHRTEVAILHADLSSLVWEPDVRYAPDFPLWQHRLTIYKPETLQSNTALLVINGGITHSKDKARSSYIKQSNDMDYARIAAKTRSVVIDLKDVPNQYLKFHHSTYLREDKLASFTWRQFLLKPEPDSHWPLHMPMTKAVIMAMDAIQSMMEMQDINIHDFVLTGGSKRGWVASLTASQDTRVSAIIPQVADFMNMNKMIKHLLSVYPSGNPAVSAYLHLPLSIDKPQSGMQQLIDIIDPFQFRHNLTMPKYIITASGDEFIPPDTNRFSFPKLPDSKWLRVLPNQGHFIARDNLALMTDTTESFFGAFIEQRDMPEISWQENDKTLIVTTSKKPKAAWLWQANNKSARDFRRLPSNTDLSDFSQSSVNFLCQQNVCQNSTRLPEAIHGWTLSFIEMHFDNAPYEDLVFTTRAFVLPDVYPNGVPIDQD